MSAEHAELAERIESLQARIRDMYDRLDGEDRAVFHGLVGELAEVTAYVEGLL